MIAHKPQVLSQIRRGHPLAEGLIGCWLFNEGSGNKTYDISGNGWDGQFTPNFNPDLHWRGSPYGWCADCGSFGDDRYVEIAPGIEGPLEQIQEATNQCTIAGWANFEDYGATREFALFAEERLTASNEVYTLGTYPSTNEWRWYVYGGSDLRAPCSFGYHFLAGSIGPAGQKLYVDGVLVASNAGSTSMYEHAYGTGNTCIGNEPNSNHDGCIDPVWVNLWNRQFEDSEIAQLYAEPYAFMQPVGLPSWLGGALAAAQTYNHVSGGEYIFGGGQVINAALFSVSGGEIIFNGGQVPSLDMYVASGGEYIWGGGQVPNLDMSAVSGGEYVFDGGQVAQSNLNTTSGGVFVFGGGQVTQLDMVATSGGETIFGGGEVASLDMAVISGGAFVFDGGQVVNVQMVVTSGGTYIFEGGAPARGPWHNVSGGEYIFGGGAATVYDEVFLRFHVEGFPGSKVFIGAPLLRKILGTAGPTKFTGKPTS